ncbi:MAG: response regulator [Qipengyuania pacifica]
MSFHKAEGLSEKDIVSMQNPNTVILVVEDEVLIRMDVVDQLGALGYRLIEAANGQEAFDALSDGGVINILFTDVHMPGDLDGVMLAREVSRRRPEIGIIVTSGSASLSADSLPEGSRFYPKPYASATVHSAIQEMLASPG